MIRIAALFAVAFVLSAVPAAAQTPTVPPRLGQCPLDTPGAIGQLTSLYQGGKWEDFHTFATRVLGAAQTMCSADQTTGQEALATIRSIDPAVDYVLLAWVAKNQFAEPTLFTAIVHTGAAPYTASLPGVGLDGARLFQIFLAPLQADALAAVYVSVRERNPLEAQMPAVIEAIVNPLFAALAQQQGDLRARAAALGVTPRTHSFWITVSSVPLPFRRAGVAAELRASVNLSSDAFGTSARTLAESLKFSEVPHSTCATTLADDLARILESKKACADQPTGCVVAVRDDFRTSFNARRDECRKEGEYAKLDSLALDKVDQAFRKLVAGQDAKEVTTKLSLRNVPLERYSFGVLAGYTAWGRTKSPRAEVEDGEVVAAPLKRSLAMVIVNIASRRYDSTLFSPSAAERYRWFAGVVVSPDIGVGGGFSTLLVRGVGLNVGAFVVASPTATSDEIGRAPSNLKDPLGSTVGGGVFVGASYNFK